MCWAAKVGNLMLTLRWMDKAQWPPTMTGESYLAMIRNEVGPEVRGRVAQRGWWWQQDSASVHCNRAFAAVLFRDRGSMNNSATALRLLLLEVRELGSLASKAIYAALFQADRQGSRSPFETFFKQSWTIFTKDVCRWRALTSNMQWSNSNLFLNFLYDIIQIRN